jgi:hypothetical protein
VYSLLLSGFCLLEPVKYPFSVHRIAALTFQPLNACFLLYHLPFFGRSLPA